MIAVVVRGGMQPTAQSAFGGALLGGWRRFFCAIGRRPRAAAGSPVVEESRAAAIDPIALTIMAVDRLGPARLRAVFHGVPVTVPAPDHATAEIFRAALLQMAKARPTDRLIRVELVAGDEAAEPALAERPAVAAR